MLLMVSKSGLREGRYADFLQLCAIRTRGLHFFVLKGTGSELHPDGNCVTTKAIPTSYSKTAGTAYVTFNDAIVPVENVIGEIGLGFAYTMYNFNHERWGMCVGGNRLSRLMVEEAFKWAS